MGYYQQEDIYLLKQIRKKRARILDVGCGEGRYLIPLSENHQVIGVDVNLTVVENLKSKGFNAIHVNDLSEIKEKFDYIIMSHILEHFSPFVMLDFVDTYLDLLKYDGTLIISTPLLSNEFFDDYDHIRPYTPKSIQLLFSDYIQHQKKPRNRLLAKNIWIRKWPHLFFFYSGESVIKRILKLSLNRVSEIVFYMSLGLFSRSTGWVGVFEKNNKSED